MLSVTQEEGKGRLRRRKAGSRVHVINASTLLTPERDKGKKGPSLQGNDSFDVAQVSSELTITWSRIWTSAKPGVLGHRGAPVALAGLSAESRASVPSRRRTG